MDGRILVVPRPTKLPISGIVKTEHQVFLDYIDAEGFPRERAAAETDERILQVIPYVLVIDAAHSTRHPFLLVGERLKGGNESRLHNRLTLGFGGHVKHSGDRSPSASFMAAVADELREELGVADALPALGVQGLIMDDHDEVGRVHLGALMVLHVSGFDAVVCGEPDKLGLFWTQTNLIRGTDLESRLERWATLSLRHIDEFIY